MINITIKQIRLFLILVSVLIPILIILADYFSLDIIWRIFRFGHMSPMFGDLRTIPMMESYDGLRENINVDPWGRPYNYPEIWIYIFTFVGLIFDPYIFFGTLQLIIYPVMFWKVSSRQIFANCCSKKLFGTSPSGSFFCTLSLQTFYCCCKLSPL